MPPTVHSVNKVLQFQNPRGIAPAWRLVGGNMNENDTNWKEVKAMKDILQGCSPNSPEAIGLNLARATKTGGLNKHDIAACLTAQKVMAVLGVDPKVLAQVTNIEKVCINSTYVCFYDLC